MNLTIQTYIYKPKPWAVDTFLWPPTHIKVKLGPHLHTQTHLHLTH